MPRGSPGRGRPGAEDARVDPMELDALYYGDCRDWMARWPDRSVDLIYLDPPFNSNAGYNVLFSGDGDSGERAAQFRAFDDTWRWDEAAEERYEAFERADPRPARQVVLGLRTALGPSGMLAYLAYMAERLEEMRRLLKPTGSIYLHCNQTAGHYLKILMDGVFGGENFIAEIVWNYGTPSGGRAGGRKPVKTHDVLLAYAREPSRHVYNRLHTPYGDKYVRDWFRHEDEDGRKYQTRSRKGKIVRQYLDESPGIPLSTVWGDIMQLYGQKGWFPKKDDENLGYPTQKPLALLERVVETASNPGDVVLDPFCGCGTAIDAARRLGRRWIGVDISAFAIDLIREKRLKDKSIPAYGLPRDMESARKLARERPFEFESWAVTRLPGFAPNARKRGDGGVDGRGLLAFAPDNHESQLALAQVKGGRFELDRFRAFAGVMARDEAALGCFVTLDPVASPSARREAAAMGRLEIQASRYPRMQLWSIAEHFDGRAPRLPPMSDPYTGKPLIQPELL